GVSVLGCAFFPQPTEHKDKVATQKKVVTRKALMIKVADMSTYLSGILHSPSLPGPSGLVLLQREAIRVRNFNRTLYG
ncbi:hypothetical protein, partial [Acidobacterium sp. S8]|uniref:hypothetical protein n=1 Tax=Acidobacterium sp. S8 TaxID=1641854 RepID=UPI001C203DA6